MASKKKDAEPVAPLDLDVDGALESIIAKALPKLTELVESEGEIERSIKCPHCSRSHLHTIKAVGNMKDLGSLVGTLTTARSKLREKDDPASARAVKIGVDLAELSNAEIAERIVALEEQLGAVTEV